MNKIVLRKIVFIITSLFLTSCNVEIKTSDAAKSEIKTFMQEYRDAWTNSDSSSVLSKLSEDIILFQASKTGKPIIGKSKLSNFWFPKTDLSYPILEYIIENEEIGVDDKLAYYQGTSILTWCTSENGVYRDTTKSISEFTTILKKQDNEWKISRIMFNLKDADYSRN